MSDITLTLQPPYLEFWAHSTYLQSCWYQVRSSSRFKTVTRMDGYKSLNIVQSAYYPPYLGRNYDINQPIFVPNKIDRIEKEYGDFKDHILPHTSTNSGLSGFKSRGFSIVDENESYMAELLSNNKNVRIVNSSNLERLNDALTTKSEIDLGKLYSGAMQDAKGKVESTEERDVSELNPVCHIDAEAHNVVQSPVPHTTDAEYPLGYDTLNDGQAFKMGVSYEGDDYELLNSLAGFGGGLRLPRNYGFIPDIRDPLPYSYDYIKQVLNGSMFSRYANFPFTPVRSARVLNGKKAFIFGDDMYRTVEPPRNSFKDSFTCMVVAKPTAIGEGKLFSAALDNQRVLVHLPWAQAGSGVFDWARSPHNSSNRLTFRVDMNNPAVYTFTASNKSQIATVRINGVTVASTSNAASHNINQPFSINGMYSGLSQRWWNPCFLGEMVFTGADISFDNWLPYEKYLMRKWRINNE